MAEDGWDLDVELGGGVVDVRAEEVMVDVDAGMRIWAELTTLLDEAPLFPVERFADYLSILTPLVVDHPLYREIADGIDAHVEKTSRSRRGCSPLSRSGHRPSSRRQSGGRST